MHADCGDNCATCSLACTTAEAKAIVILLKRLSRELSVEGDVTWGGPQRTRGVTAYLAR